MSNPTQEPNWQRTAWLVVALLWPVALLNYMDRQMLAAMKFSVMQDIPDIELEAKWGLILGCFKWVYAAVSPLGGYLADRLSKRWVIVVSLAVWSAVTWMTGHVTSYNGMLFTRALMGISEACYIPAALALISDFHLGPTRSRAVGIHQTAIYAGIILGGFSGHVAEDPKLGWRLAFDAAGIVGILYAIPLALFLRNAPRVQLANSAGSPSFPAAAGELLRTPSFILLVICFTLPAMAGWMVKDWMPAILKDKFDIGQGVAGVSATLYANIASFAAAFGGGYLADRWMRKTERGRIRVSALGIFLLIPALIGVGNSGSLTVAVCFLLLFGIGWGFFDCNNMPILCQIARPELRATGYGIMNLVSTSIGGVTDVWVGYLRDHQVPNPIIFGVFASLAGICVFLMLKIRPHISDRPAS